MSKVWIVAWRDFKQTVLRKAFLIAVLGIPLLILIVIAAAALIIVGHKEPPLIGTVAVVDRSGEVAEALRLAFRESKDDVADLVESTMSPGMGLGMGGGSTRIPGMTRGEIRVDVEVLEVEPAEVIDQLHQRVRTGELLAAAIIAPETLQPIETDASSPGAPGLGFELLVTSDLDGDHTDLIERRVGDAVVRVRATRAGLDPDRTAAILKRPRSSTRRILESGEEASESEATRELKQIVPMIFMMLLWVATFTAGQHLMMSTIEEKSNRVMEVLLSAVSPLQLMTGKILGQGGVGLLIVLIYSSLTIGGLVVFALMHIIEMMDLVYLAIYFFMAYFMIASVMAAIGSAVSDIREANTLLTPVMIVLMIPLMLWLPISNAPNGAVATTFSFIPPAIPFAMILRIAADEPVPTWQIPVSIIWGYGCVVAMVLMAAKIFRVGVLMYGKPPSPLQLLKWLRYS